MGYRKTLTVTTTIEVMPQRASVGSPKIKRSLVILRGSPSSTTNLLRSFLHNLIQSQGFSNTFANLQASLAAASANSIEQQM